MSKEPLSVTVQRAAFALQQVGYSAEFVQRVMRASEIVKDAEKLGAWQALAQQGVYGTYALLGAGLQNAAGSESWPAGEVKA